MPETVTQTTDSTVEIVEKETPKTETTSTTETKVEPKKEEPTKAAPDKTSLLNKEEPKKDEPKAGPPEKYEAWKLPEGFEMPEAKLTKINETFKELGITQEAGQKLIDFYADEIKAVTQANGEAYMNLRKEWQGKVTSDPEIGKIMPEVKATISKALDGLGQPELVTSFKEAMDLTGAGDHPAFIKTFWYLAQKAVEGKHVSGKGPTDQGKPRTPVSPAQAMYPNLPSANQS